jgi:hypothetical protein
MSKFIECCFADDRCGGVFYLNIDRAIKFEVKQDSEYNFFNIEVFTEEADVVLPFKTKTFEKNGDKEYEEAYAEAQDYLKKFIEQLNK